MVQDGDLEVLQLLSSTSAKIAQGEVLQLQHKSEADLLEETYIDIINLKTAAFFLQRQKLVLVFLEVMKKKKSFRVLRKKFRLGFSDC